MSVQMEKLMEKIRSDNGGSDKTLSHYLIIRPWRDKHKSGVTWSLRLGDAKPQTSTVKLFN
jgi:hypothetical protein